jgi:peptidoglycan/LPS O-acetylase OafA/YrhL
MKAPSDEFKADQRRETMTFASIASSQPENAQSSGGERSLALTTTDLLKVIGVAAFLLDHYGLYFDPDQGWWRVFGRLAVPIFFFLIGFARSRQIPWTWIALGSVLTALEVWTSWDEGLKGMSLNILFNFLILRLAVLPLMERIMLAQWRWLALPILVIGCVLLIGVSDRVVEYGTGGWLWALLGLSLRLAQEGEGHTPSSLRRWIPVALAVVAAVACVVRESIDHQFAIAQIVTLATMIAVLTPGLLVFRRAALSVQPPAPIAPFFRFCGRYSLEIYAVTLLAMQVTGHVIGTDGDG